MASGPRVALVHDWLTGLRGGERCLEVFCELLPDADLFTLLHVPGSVSPAIERHPIRTSFVQRLPMARRRYRWYLPLFPRAVESFDLSGYDAVVSISHCVAKGAVPRAGAPHLCYCLTPVRYAWDLSDQYFGSWPPPMSWGVRAVLAGLRNWDRGTSSRATRYVAISKFVGERIRRHYGRESDVIYPPVDCERFRVAPAHEGFDLVVSALVPYKRVDLAVEAANRLKRPLVIVGSGPEERKLRALAGGTVRFVGWKSDPEVAQLYARCRTLVFPGEEDFGITPLEAMACGKPVIAYGRGGVTETVTQETGIFFPEQTPDALCEALRTFDAREKSFDPAAIRRRAEAFDLPRYRDELRSALRRDGIL